MKFERNEYPRPQFRRREWQNLNGEWEFEFDDDGNGISRSIQEGKTPLKGKINVPFSYQWKASGIGDTSVHSVMWYRRKFTLPAKKEGVLLCFNGSDYLTDVWVNGKHALTHRGGFAPFNADISSLVCEGENTVVVRCYDDLESAVPRGKQSWKDGKPFSCFYIPNSGIWQSVWIEYFGSDCIESYGLRSDADNFLLKGEISTLNGKADEVGLTVTFKGQPVTSLKLGLDGRRTEFCVSLVKDGFDSSEFLWFPDSPNLVDVEFTLYCKGEVVDSAKTRTGLRKIKVDDEGHICINQRLLYQRLILDQGYWEESGLTPPSAEALKKDISLAKAMGFNGARKHQKYEDPYFYYYAEEMGFLTWCEMPSAYTFCDREISAVTQEWQEILQTAKNFTSNICYVPLNESWGVGTIRTDKNQQNFGTALYYLTKAIDRGDKLISTNDGFDNLETSDILSIHDYDIAKTETFATKYISGKYDGLHPQGFALFADGNRYRGQPVLFTEYGGIAFTKDSKNGCWGYNGGVKDEKELLERLEELNDGILLTEFQGFCYTQLTDVQQEVNGLLYADRTPKADLDKLRKIFGRNK